MEVTFPEGGGPDFIPAGAPGSKSFGGRVGLLARPRQAACCKYRLLRLAAYPAWWHRRGVIAASGPARAQLVSLTNLCAPKWRVGSLGASLGDPVLPAASTVHHLPCCVSGRLGTREGLYYCVSVFWKRAPVSACPALRCTTCTASVNISSLLNFFAGSAPCN